MKTFLKGRHGNAFLRHAKIFDKPGDFVIKLQMTTGVMFWRARPDWSGSHFTHDIGQARRYKRKGNAERVIDAFSWKKDGLDPKVIPAKEWYVK